MKGMAERPKSRLPGGKINPAYTAWRKENITEKVKPVALVPDRGSPVETITIGEDFNPDEPLPIKSVTIREVATTFAPIPVDPSILTLKCIKAAKNPKYVFCDLNGVKVAVKCKRGLSKKMPGKRIKVQLEADGTYTHIR